jgi:ATP-binding cassette subfamily B protein
VRAAFAVVPQDALLFDDTIRENIRYGRLDASDEEVEQVAAAAHVNQFSDALPAGLDTRIGERGVRLSGGQRQLIAIARAILRDAPILLLDEPTSSLDAQFETYVQDALHTLMAGRTTFIIAHHARTVAGADQIVLLAGGRVLMVGTHAELNATSSEYRQLFANERTALPSDDS